MTLITSEFLKFMKKFDNYPFEITIDGQKNKIGEGEAAFSVIFNKIPSLSSLITSTSLALGEGYMNGDIEIEGDLYNALSCFLSQVDKFSTDKVKLKKLIFTSSSRKNQKKEISSHYDIGNDFYKLWLDETMSYSCGYFKNDKSSLYEAQCSKVERILEKLYLKEGMSICDIGCGWGCLLIQAAKKYNINGVGITLSVEQKKEFERRIKAEGLEERLRVELLDYRDIGSLKMSFDRVVSVGMLEHVGRKNYAEFISCVKSVLNKGGLFLLHFISALKENPGDPWIKKYIFPGGVVPSLREIINTASEMKFYTIDVESLRRHYNRTLLCWNENFQKNRDKVKEMFDEKFVRMWELYLCSCAAVFINGITDLHQVLFTNDVNNDLPMTRWY